MKSIELGEVTVHNIKQLKKLNQIVFPVSYNDKFYKDVLDVGPLAKLGFFFKLWIQIQNFKLNFKLKKKHILMT